MLVGGEAFPIQSPCGINCTYTTQFGAPYFECNKSTNTNTHAAQETLNIYSGAWFAPTAPQSALGGPRYNGTYTLANFNSTTLKPISISNNTGNSTEAKVIVSEENTICAPGRAKYTVNNIWENNVHKRNFTREPIDRLVNLALATRDGAVLVPNFSLNRTRVYGTAPANWTKATLDIYRDNNMMAILSAMMSWLHGDFQASLAQLDNDNTRNVTFMKAWHEAVFFEREEGVLFSDGGM